MFSSLDGLKGVSKKFKESCRTDDWADRMSHLYTTFMLLIVAVLLSAAQEVGTKIKCWLPAQLGKDWHNDYANNYCWVSNTYRIPMLDSIPVEIDTRQEAEITYYQWVPLILAFQAFLFYLPNFIWNVLNGHSGLNLGKVRSLADDTQSKSPKEREEVINNIASVLHRWIEILKPYSHSRMTQAKSKLAQVCFLYCNKREGTYLTGLFLFIKVLFVLNAVGQFYLLNAFMGTELSLFGYEYMHALSAGTLVKESPRFPRITLCDFEIRQLQNIQRWTVQCVLPINLFNEKFFLFIWFWLVMIGVISCVSLIKWTYVYMFRQHAYTYVKKYLTLNKPDRTFSSSDKKLVRHFAERYLRNDGCFVAWMIGHNSTELVVMDLLEKMWGDYKEKMSDQIHRRPHAHTNSHVTS